MLTKEYFVNGTTAEKVAEEGLKLYGKCMDDHTCDRALYLYPDGSMNVLEGDGMPAKESRAICIASYGADDGDYLDAAYEQIEEAIMSSIPEVEQQKIQDYMVDRKIPKEFRNRLEMIAIGGEILWILPNSGIPNEVEQKKGRISQKYQIEEGSKAFLFLEITDCL